jgi:hypothetical protein
MVCPCGVGAGRPVSGRQAGRSLKKYFKKKYKYFIYISKVIILALSNNH